MRLRSLILLFLALAGVPSAFATDPLFDQRVLHETRIEMDPADWQALRENFRTNQYYAANASFDGEVVEQVGVRSRGKGSRDDKKPGLRVDFNRYGKDLEFHGMKSLVLDNEIQDSSLLREALAYAVFQAMGIEAPQIAYARVTVNGEYWGVYAQTEDLRKSFLKERFGSDDDGNLFKYEWAGAYDFSWRGEDPGLYIPEPFEPHSNEETLDPTELIDFIRSINETPDDMFLAQIANYIDVRKFLSYVAVENALAESDGLLGDQGMNNFYIYQSEDSSRFTFIPWDKDNSLQLAEWPLFRGVEGNLLVQRLLSDDALRAFYASEVKRAVSLYVNRSWLLPRLESNYRLIREAAISDPMKPQSNDEFEVSVEGLRGVIEGRAADVAQQLRQVAPRRP